MPNRPTLSPTAQAVIEQEAKRIAQLGDAWQPTPENLTEVVKTVLAVEQAQFKKQTENPLEGQEAKPLIGYSSRKIGPREKKGKKASAEKRPLGRPKKLVEPDKVRLLAFLQDSAPGPKSMTVMSKAEIARHMGFSISKTKAMMKGMEEKGLIETHQRTAASGSQLENAYRTTRFGKRLLKRSLEEKQGDE